MPTTSNFGWTTPADTDLVKDGAAAIRTLGNGIDTSFIDLKGGTTGQVLSKASNTDLDYSWVTPNVGDITEVQAGTGISVSSGTGPIPVVTNTVATAFDAAGDLIYGTGADTFTKLALGTAGQVLKVNSGATAPEWGAATGSFVGASAFKNTSVASQSVANNTATAITFNDEDYDTDGFHSTSTNTSRFTVPSGKGGYYLLSATISYDVNNTGNRALYFYKNGSAYHYAEQANGISTWATMMNAALVINLAVGDYVELYAYQNSGGNLDVLRADTNTRMQITYLGA